MDSIGGRKFVIALLSLGSASFLVWFEKITPGAYETVMMAVSAVFAGTNVLQKVFTK